MTLKQNGVYKYYHAEWHAESVLLAYCVVVGTHS